MASVYKPLLDADDFCTVSLSSASPQQLMSIFDQYCASHSLTFNVCKSACMFFKGKMNKLCDNISVVLSANNIDFVHEKNYLGLITILSMKTSDVVRQTRKFYANQYVTAQFLFMHLLFKMCVNQVILC